LTPNWNSFLSQTLIQFNLQTLKVNKYSISNPIVLHIFYVSNNVSFSRLSSLHILTCS